MDFVDLKTQYRALRETIDARIRRVLEHGQYNLGPEVAEMEQRLAGRAPGTASRSLRAPRRG